MQLRREKKLQKQTTQTIKNSVCGDVGQKMLNSLDLMVIESFRTDGQRFRPSDWIERLSSVLASFGPDHRLHYSKKVRPKIIDGEKCLVVDKSLKDEDPAAYEYICKFVETNGLKTRGE